jgi:hypothetical protein
VICLPLDGDPPECVYVSDGTLSLARKNIGINDTAHILKMHFDGTAGHLGLKPVYGGEHKSVVNKRV